MINMYTEKIYVFLWFWFILVGFVSIISVCYWIVALCVSSNQREFVEKYLRCKDIIGETPTRDEENEVSSFLTKRLFRLPSLSRIS